MIYLDNEEDVDEFLDHHGVKGQKWGVRKSRKSGDKPSRKERRQANKKAKKKFYDDKVSSIIKAASKGDKTLIKMDDGLVVTGRQFANYLSNGGAFNVRLTEVYAIRSGNKPYQLQEAVGSFKKNRS